jgi:4-diphosphocytidyl-2-C-methyl-D-erythritol kinase
MTDTIRLNAPAKINLALHVTGQRADGYHLLDSLVMFADFGDSVTVSRADEISMQVSGPLAAGVPVDQRNLCWRAAELFGEGAQIHLGKHLPHAAGIGGGSSDAAAVLNAMAQLYGARDLDDLTLGADVPVCRLARSARMSGIGEELQPLPLPELPALLVNPGVEVPTPVVFKGLASKDNPPMTTPPTGGVLDLIEWLHEQRNDLEAPAVDAAPVIATVLEDLRNLPGARLARMSGSGATCFALFETQNQAEQAGKALSLARPEWWVQPCRLS